MIIYSPTISGSLSFQQGNNTITGETVNLTGSFSGSLTGDMTVTGDIVPNVSGAYDLGSEALPFRDIYVSQNSLKFIDTNSGREIGRISVNPNTGDVKLLKTKNLTRQQLENLTAETAGAESISPVSASALWVSESIAAGHTNTAIGHSTAPFHTLHTQFVSGSSATLTGTVTATTFTGSFVGDGSQLSGVTSYTDSDTLTYINTVGVLSGSAQIASDISGSFISVSQSFASERLKNTSDTLDGDLTVTGKITAQEFHTEFVSASIIYQSGSTKFGNTSDDRHEFTGSIYVSNGMFSNLTGNVTGTASNASNLNNQAASYYLNYNNFTNTPTIPTNNNQLTNGAGYLTGITSGDVTTALGYTPWHATNDGAGSGLDADTLDGIQGTSFLRSDTADTMNGLFTALGGIDMNNSSILNVGGITINDPGVGEGIQWNGGNGWQIYESPDAMNNAAGNLQFTTGTTFKFRVDTSGNTFSAGSSRAPIFYDSDNTAYYINPTGNSVLGPKTTIVNDSGNVAALALSENILEEHVILEYDGTGGGATNHFHIYSGIDSWAQKGSSFNLQPSTGNIDIGGLNFGYKFRVDGTTLLIDDNPLTLYTDTNAVGLKVKFSDHAGGNYAQNGTLEFVHANGDSFGQGAAFKFYSTEAMAFHVAGTGLFTGDVTAYYSDMRLKTKLGDIEKPIEKIKSLNGFYYEPNEIAESYGYQKEKRIGLSAQDVESVLPEIVTDAPIGEGYKAVDYAKLVPVLVEAIKEQQRQIEELKSLINK